jgi:hypothetical protein
MSNLILQNTFGSLNLTDIILVLNNPNFTVFFGRKESHFQNFHATHFLDYGSSFTFYEDPFIVMYVANN